MVTMNSAQKLFWDLIDHPFCTIFILLISWLWVKSIYHEVDIRKYSLSINDCFTNKQYWRIITAPFLHVSFVHLLLDISCIWNLRYVEINYGTWFIVRYSLILCLSETLITYGIMKTFSRFVDNTVLTEILFKLQYHGSSGLVLGWLAFQSVEVMNEKFDALFLLFGLLSIPSSFAPVILIGLYYLCIPRNNGVANSSGMFAGYLLGVGFLRIMDNTYWTICILFNLFAFLLITSKGTAVPADRNNELSSTSRGGTTNSSAPMRDELGTVHEQISLRYYQNARNDEFLESLVPSTADDSHGTDSSVEVEMRTLSRRRTTNLNEDMESKIGEDMKEEDSLEPLLSDNSNERNRDTYSSMGWSHVWPFRGTGNNIMAMNRSSAIPISGSSLASSTGQSTSSHVPHRLLVNEEDNV